MYDEQLIECVPNFSEGRDLNIIRQITGEIERVEGVKLLDVDPGRDTNRTVVTFVGAPGPVVEAAFRAIRKAAELIDMGRHRGQHPRMGATDVCPLIPLANISMEEVVGWARQLGEMTGRELGIPVYLYGHAASRPERADLAFVRSGEYEGLSEKLSQPEWKPDYGPASFNPQAGATAVGARDFLIAFNVNLNTTSVRRANSVAFDVREKGRLKREGDPLSGPVVLDEQGVPVRVPGECKGVKAIGWYLEEYGQAQVSMNLTDIRQTPLHIAFEACRRSASRRGMRVTGSEMIGMVPRAVLLDAGYYYLDAQGRSRGISESEVIRIALKSLGLEEHGAFDPQQKIIEYRLQESAASPLRRASLQQFADLTASELVTPGGGSVAACVGALGVALGVMAANVSANRRIGAEQLRLFSEAALEGQRLKDQLLRLVDEDAAAFQAVLEARRLPRSSAAEEKIRTEAMQKAFRRATEAPAQVMRLAVQGFDLLEKMLETAIPGAKTDIQAGVLCLRAAVRAASLNVQVNAGDLAEEAYASAILEECGQLTALAEERGKALFQKGEDQD